MSLRPFLISVLILLSFTGLWASDPPTAEILSSDTAWCMKSTNISQAEIRITGIEENSTFDLVLEIKGKADTLDNLPHGIFSFYLNNQEGENVYIINEIIEHQTYATIKNAVYDTLRITVHPLPNMEVELDYKDLCTPAGVTFMAVDGYKTYAWDFGDGIWQGSASSTITKSYTHSGSENPMPVNNRMKIESRYGCLDSVDIPLAIYIAPEPAFDAAPQTQDYPNTTVSVSNQTTGDWSYTWDYGDGTRVNEKDPPPYEFNNWGRMTITLVASGGNCKDSTSRQVYIIPPEPVAGIDADTMEGCIPLTVAFNNTSLYADSYFWDFGDGDISLEKNPVHTFTDNKDYTVKLRATGLSGIDSTNEIVTVHPLPEAAFDADLTGPDLSEPVTFYNNSSGASNYLWDFGDGSTSSLVSPSHTYSETGTYTVKLYAWSEFGCADSLTQEDMITVVESSDRPYFPNVFCWNGSGPTGGSWGMNPTDIFVFHPGSRALKDATGMKMIIITRMGLKIFESNDLEIGWDGYTPTGELAPTGVYIYRTWITYSNGEEKLYTGDVTFLHHNPFSN